MLGRSRTQSGARAALRGGLAARWRGSVEASFHRSSGRRLEPSLGPKSKESKFKQQVVEQPGAGMLVLIKQPPVRLLVMVTSS